MTGLQKLVEWLNAYKKDRNAYPTQIAIEAKIHEILAEERRDCEAVKRTTYGKKDKI